MLGLEVEGQKIYFSTQIRLSVLILSLLLMQVAVTAAAPIGETGALPNTAAYYQEKVTEFQVSDYARALLYADSMLVAASRKQDHLLMAEAMKMQGDLHVKSGDFASAVLLYNKALVLTAQQGERQLAVRIHNNLGSVYLKTSNYDKALSQYNRAYSLGRSYLTAIQKATLLNNLGLIYRHLNQYNQSSIYLQEALEIYFQEDHVPGIGQVYNNLGILAQQMNNYDEARKYYTLAKELGEKSKRPVGVAYAASNLASLYLDEDKPEKSLAYNYTAYHIKKKLDDKLGLFNTHSSLGRAWIMLARPDSAAYHYIAASLYADSIENVNKKIEALTGLSDAYKLEGKATALAQVFSRILTLKDSSFNQERAAQLSIAQAELETMQKEDVIKELTEEAVEASNKLRLRELVLYASVPLLVLLVIFTIVYLRRFHSERLAHQQLFLRLEEIKGQKEKIEQQHQTIRQQNLELQDANKLIEHYNTELESINEQLEQKIRERTRALTDTYRKLSFHINNTPLAVLEWNKKLALVRWPEQAEKIFGYKTQQVLGKEAEKLPFMQDEKHLLFVQNIREAHLGLQAKQVSFQQELQKENGQQIFVEWSHSVLTDEQGEVESVLSIASEVSLRERAFQEVKLINKELDTFIYKASHDLRGPIARMQGIINLGKIESSDPQAHFYFDLLNRVSGELHNLLMRLLMVHNIHQHLLCTEKINLYAFVQELINELPEHQKAALFTFHINIPKDLQLTSDKNLLSIVILNLLENSLNFADNNKPFIIISAMVQHGKILCLRVQDNGPGISEHLQEKVFDMFFQGSTKSTGMGLGLYMVRKAVSRLGGEIRLDKDDELTTFTILLPESDLMKLSPVSENLKVIVG